MRDYSFSELGMLAGAAIGGAIAVIGFSISGNALFFVIAGIGTAVGIILGKTADMRRMK